MPVVPDPANVETKLPEPPERIRAIDPETQASRAAREAARVLEAELTARISGEVRFDRTSRISLRETRLAAALFSPSGTIAIPSSRPAALERTISCVSDSFGILCSLVRREQHALSPARPRDGDMAGGVRERVAKAPRQYTQQCSLSA